MANKVLKNTMFFAVAICSTGAFAVAAEDAVVDNSAAGHVLISYKTSGQDRYSDGSLVTTKECYALVWSKNGDFKGFDSAGKLVNTELNHLFRVVALVPGESCVFDLEREEFKTYARWSMAVYLLDTRGGPDNQPACLDENGNLIRVSRWGVAAVPTPSVRVVGEGDFISDFDVSAEGSEADSDLTKEEAGAEPIKITSFRVENGQAIVTTRGGSSTCTYALKSGGSATELSGEGDPQSGMGQNVFRQKLQNTASCQFYSVMRTK